MQQAKTNKLNKTMGKKGKTDKDAKSHSWLQNFFLIFIIIVLTGFIVIGSIFFFNIGGGKPIIIKTISNIPLIGNLVKPVIENKTPEEIEAEKLQATKNEIAIQTKQLEEKKKEIEERESNINRKEELLELKEKEINDILKQLNEKLNSIYEQVEYFEKMNPANATLIISNMENKGAVVQILRNMSKEKSSKILMLMDPLQAAQILEDIKEQDRLNYLID